ncbi:MAG TPA: lipoyl synthase [Acetomicrobium flavidum]|uniref:lipoyl synthase n=1 Tax=Acetomicrobium TaxID=49894 RepID=UPI0026EBE60A|nr:lipoyl synthase [Acetomicrobium mobile]HOB43790.1 lipoyl synthase [Bacillota bacterium]HOJ82850.1 lipoyl synthase [Acetomicrobium flavidum]HPU69669.1 lipoyl synthase [Acetomicrobium flavidum]
MNGEFPEWLKIPAPDEKSLYEMQDLIKGMTLHTVCEEALCPNVGECFKSRTATFLLMGDVCTRNCNFCAVRHGNPLPLDPDEPRHIAEACKALGLKYVVLTCVTRDDLADGGASHMALVVEEVKRLNPGAKVELLTSDLGGSRDALKNLFEAPLDVLAHNVETVPSLYPAVRPQANYERSLAVIEMAKAIAPKVLTKSGIMVGLGETYEEVIEVMSDLISVGCDILTIGQYLQPSPSHLPVKEFVPPKQYQMYEQKGLELGFKYVVAGPLVRSSYRASAYQP